MIAYVADDGVLVLPYYIDSNILTLKHTLVLLAEVTPTCAFAFSSDGYPCRASGVPDIVLASRGFYDIVLEDDV